MTFTGHFDGVEAAPGVYGFHTLTQTFNIGQSLIAVGYTQTHHTQIYVNGKLKYDWPISSGRPGDDTPDGSYLTIEKENPVRMTGPGYSLEVPYSVRFTFSGDYYHDAYWSVGEQGFENVSHGCVNLSPADAADLLQPGRAGRPDHDHGQPEIRHLGQRLDRVVPELDPVPEGQRAARGGGGRAERQHVREPVELAPGHREGPDADRGGRERGRLGTGTDGGQEGRVGPREVPDALLEAGHRVELLAELEVVAVEDDRLQHGVPRGAQRAAATASGDRRVGADLGEEGRGQGVGRDRSG